MKAYCINCLHGLYCQSENSVWQKRLPKTNSLRKSMIISKYKINVKKISIMMCLLSFYVLLEAQQNTHSLNSAPRITTPEASTLIKYINYPVSYSRGLADISIPLLEIKSDGLTIPLSLSYHHAGLKPDEKTTWIGQGWSINGLFSVTKMVNGAMDNGIKYQPIKPLSECTPGTGHFWNSYQAGNIEDPDEYYYNIADKSGNFIYKADNNVFTPITYPYEPIKIDFDQDVFIITDDDGTIYKFSLTDFPVHDTYKASRVYRINEIITRNRSDTIRFTYKAPIQKYIFRVGHYIKTIESEELYNEKKQPTSSNETIISTPNWTITRGNTLGIYDLSVERGFPYREIDESEYIDNTYIYNDGSFQGEWPASLHAYNSCLLNSITFKGGVIHFYYTQKTDDKTKGSLYEYLRTIELKNNEGGIVKQINFNNRFVKSGIGPNDFSFYSSYPLLESIDIRNKNEETEGSYNFSYNGDPFVGITTERVDFWGFFTGDKAYVSGTSLGNNVENFGQYIPLSANIYPNGGLRAYNLCISGTNRERPTSQNGLLTSIINPLGGITTFEYESNCYLKEYVPFTSYASYGINLWEYGTAEIKTKKQFTAGLRIKRITDYEPVLGTTLIREFKYGENEDGIGIVKDQIMVDDFSYKTNIVWQQDPRHNNRYNSVTETTYTNDLFGDRMINGSFILYGQVSEYMIHKNKNGEIIDNGKTVYCYNTCYSKGHSEGIITGNIYVDQKLNWELGQLLSTTTYRKSNEEYIPLKKTDYRYLIFYKEEIPVRKLFKHRVYMDLNQNDPLNLSKFDLSISHKTFNVKSGVSKIQTETKILYTENGEIMTKNEYTYENPKHLYPTRIKTTNSDGFTIENIFSYPMDESSLSTSEHIEAKSELIRIGNISPVLEEKRIVKNNVFSKINSYKVYPNRLVLPHKIIEQQKDKAQYTRIEVFVYDSYGNPLYVEENGITITYLWSYQGQYPIAKIKNALYSEVETAVKDIFSVSCIDDLSQKITIGEDELRKLRGSAMLRDAHITTYAYKPLVGMISQTSPMGITTYYEYDDFRRLKESYLIDKDSKQKRIVERIKYHYKSQ